MRLTVRHLYRDLVAISGCSVMLSDSGLAIRCHRAVLRDGIIAEPPSWFTLYNVPVCDVLPSDSYSTRALNTSYFVIMLMRSGSLFPSTCYNLRLLGCGVLRLLAVRQALLPLGFTDPSDCASGESDEFNVMQYHVIAYYRSAVVDRCHGGLASAATTLSSAIDHQVAYSLGLLHDTYVNFYMCGLRVLLSGKLPPIRASLTNDSRLRCYEIMSSENDVFGLPDDISCLYPVLRDRASL